MDKLVPALLLAALSGLTVLAYQHPDAYGTMGQYIIFGLLGLWVLINVWEFGVGLVHVNLAPFIKMEDQEAANGAIADMTFTNWRIHIGFYCMIGYLIFLGVLPKLLGE